MNIFATLALLLASSLADFGQSPLLEPGHNHSWELLIDDPDGDVIWDENYKSSLEVDGEQLVTILLRSKIQDQGGQFTTDLIMAVDCEARQLGVVQIWLFEENGATVNSELPVGEVRMDFGETPPSPDDLKIYAAACAA